MGAVARKDARSPATQGGCELDVVLEVLVGDVGGFAEQRGVEGDDGKDREDQADGGEGVVPADELRGDVVDVVDGNGRDEASFSVSGMLSTILTSACFVYTYTESCL